ncbi:hypothetical protein NQ317_019745 [Molorchus minor]|uniref:ZAD domain-containing protein n=1 Tax=Molorchus minor TaxID=1323400 RepID=A0ABQ9K4T1_9CUCU|nr:hypothetical protein NQ317_019745 [Molorchus minor]
MNLNILFKDFPKICRLCLSPGSVQPILDVKVLSILCAITNIEIKEDDKLPENICNICVKQLEGINKCGSREYEKSLAAEEESQDFCIDDRFDDDDDFHIKDESEGEDVPKFVTVKQEFGIDPDITDINLNKEDGPVSCENCSENFADRKTLHEHYNEIRNCRPIDYNSESSDVPNILDYLKNIVFSYLKENEQKTCNITLFERFKLFLGSSIIVLLNVLYSYSVIGVFLWTSG